MYDPHPTSERLAYRDVTSLRRELASGELTSVELVEQLLERVVALDGADTSTALRAMAGINRDALDEARRSDDARERGVDRGALHGVPVVIKDNIEAVGLPGLAGSTSLRGRPAREAPVVARLRGAGAVVMGSTNLSQWANLRSPRSTSGWSASGGLVANPWALDRSAGGSSSGSGAALAAGYAPLAVGTETDGSVVCPSSLQGLVGLKPTIGVIDTRHVVPISASQDSPGPMGRCVEDVATMFSVMSGQARPTTTPTPRFALASTWTSDHPATDALYALVIDALRRAGHAVIEREVPTPDESVQGDELTVLVAEFYDDLGAYLADRPGEGVHSMEDVIAYESEHAELELAHFGHELLEMAVESKGRAGPNYHAARQRNLEWATTTCLGPALEGVDVLLAPSYGPAWKSDLTLGGHAGAVASCATTPSAIAGWPIMSVPVGLVDGLPVGLALVGRAGSEWRLLEGARLIESLVAERGYVCRPTWRAPNRG